ncbi:MAG: hypothetical protein WBQ76_16815 [Candidatus Korobacteraceae bacterium]
MSANTAAYQKTDRGKQALKKAQKKYFETSRGKGALKRGLEKQQDKGYYRFGRGAISILRQGALRRGLTFALTPESLDNWWREVPDICAYCGITTAEFIRLRDYVNAYAGSDYEITKFRRVFKSSKQAAIRWLTLDRADNARGYELDNLVKCCWFCNYVKGSLLTHADMLLVGKSIVERLSVRIAEAESQTRQD